MFRRVVALALVAGSPIAASADADSTTCSAGRGGDSGGRTLSRLEDGAPIWHDVAGSEFRNVPEFSKGAFVDAPGQRLAAATPFRFYCSLSDGVTCDAYVLLYECEGCPTEKGGLPAQLVGHGFHRSRCAPDFVTGVPGGAHRRFTAYRMVLNAGQEVSFTTIGDVEWAALAIKSGPSIDCSAFGTASACDTQSLDFCRWQGQCVAKTCLPLGPGPGRAGCGAPCVHSEWTAAPAP